MFVTLFTGLSLWVGYGFLKNDWVVVIANAISLCLLGGILFFKIRNKVAPHKRPAKAA